MSDTTEEPDLPVAAASNDVIGFFWSSTSSTDLPPQPLTTTTTTEATTTTTEETTTTTTEATEATTTKWFHPGTPEPPSPETPMGPDTEKVDWSAFADAMKKKLDESGGSVENTDSASSDPLPLVEVGSVTEEKTYFSCSPFVTAEDGTLSLPGASPIVVHYDYDVVTNAADLDANTLSALDDEITKNLAGLYGLTTCKRRNLRGLRELSILALDSKPADVSVADTCK